MASAFHETNLSSVLNFHRIDTVIVTGVTMAGCVSRCGGLRSLTSEATAPTALCLVLLGMAFDPFDDADERCRSASPGGDSSIW